MSPHPGEGVRPLTGISPKPSITPGSYFMSQQVNAQSRMNEGMGYGELGTPRVASRPSADLPIQAGAPGPAPKASPPRECFQAFSSMDSTSGPVRVHLIRFNPPSQAGVCGLPSTCHCLALCLRFMFTPLGRAVPHIRGQKETSPSGLELTATSLYNTRMMKMQNL